MAFAHMQKPGDGIYLGPCQQYGLDWGISQPIRARVQCRGRGDLLAQIRAGIDQQPILTIHRSDDARLAARWCGGIARTGSLAAGAGGIPLRKPAPGAGAEYDHPEQ